MAPSASTKALSSDRGIIGKIAGHLYIAAKALVEGQVSSMQEIRHEIRAIVHAGGPDIITNKLKETSEATMSLLSWNQKVRAIILTARTLPNNCTVPDEFKQDFANAIKQGRKLSGGSSRVSKEARTQIDMAAELYLELSGVSYL
jgi:hypothetical protein